MNLDDDQRQDQLKAIENKKYEAAQEKSTKMNSKQGLGKKGSIDQLINVKDVDIKALKDSIQDKKTLYKKKMKTERAQPNEGSKFDYDLNVEVLEEAKREHQRI